MKPVFKISKNWDCIASLEELISKSLFIFLNDENSGVRPRIVLKEAINGIDCIEIDYDQWGLTTNGETKFNNNWGGMIADSSKDCISFIKDFLIKEGAYDLIYHPLISKP